MIFKPFHYFDTGCASYVFGCGTLGLCAVVDPQERDTDAYIAFADAKEMRITHIIDTHLHADHRSGGRALASRTGASYCLHYSADVDFPFEPLDDGQTIELGNTIVHVLHTPGHTLEMVFGIVKALTNYFAGRLSDAVGRKTVPVAGWLIAVPVPFLLMWAPSWNWILAANALLGVSQGLTWSTTVIMKIDLAGPERRGLAMGLNEFAGYGAVALSALAMIGLLLSALLVRETHGHVRHEAKNHGTPAQATRSQREVFLYTSFLDRNLSSISQAGLVNNLNDGMAWGLFPIFYAAAGLSLERIGWLAAIYPAVWDVGQLFTGRAFGPRRTQMADHGGNVGPGGRHRADCAVDRIPGLCGRLGAGTAMAYPTLLAAIGDVAHPVWHASSVGVYRLWRDLGYTIGALLAGVTADALGLPAAI